MAQKPIFVATHPRACSTAFERVFMTQRDTLTCIHEPFGDAFYFGPERLGDRYEGDRTARMESGFSKSTYQTILDRFERESAEGKRLFIKDITHYLVPPNGKDSVVAPSLVHHKRGVGTSKPVKGVKGSKPDPQYPYDNEPEPNNPTVVPREVLEKFHFTFLIRHPRRSIPSYFRCTIPPLDEYTGFYSFDPSEAGYDELRRVFDYLRSSGQIGPAVAGKTEGATNGVVDDHVNGDVHKYTNGLANGHTNGQTNGHTDGLTNGHTNGLANGHTNGQTNGHTNGLTNGHTNGVTNGHVKGHKDDNVKGTGNPVDSTHTNGHQAAGNGPVEICVIDADDLLDDPYGIIKQYCKSVNLEFQPSMLVWDTEEDHRQAVDAFAKWRGFHNDAIESDALRPRTHKKKEKAEEDEYKEWVEKYGEQGAKVIKETVQNNIDDYEYLKQFAIKPRHRPE